MHRGYALVQEGCFRVRIVALVKSLTCSGSAVLQQACLHMPGCLQERRLDGLHVAWLTNPALGQQPVRSSQPDASLQHCCSAGQRQTGWLPGRRAGAGCAARGPAPPGLPAGWQRPDWAPAESRCRPATGPPCPGPCPPDPHAALGSAGLQVPACPRTRPTCSQPENKPAQRWERLERGKAVRHPPHPTLPHTQPLALAFPATPHPVPPRPIPPHQ